MYHRDVLFVNQQKKQLYQEISFYVSYNLDCASMQLYVDRFNWMQRNDECELP